MSIILFLDTTDYNKVTFAVSDGKKALKKTFQVDPHKSHETLKILDGFLKKYKGPKNKIQKIIVNKGPGSYTGVRVGVTLASALGFALDIPVKFISNDKFTIK